MQDIKIRKTKCKSAIGKCGFEAGSFCINPYIGCGHACVYCYARFIKRFTDHKEPWGTFVDVKTNIAEVLEKQLRGERDSSIRTGVLTRNDPVKLLTGQGITSSAPSASSRGKQIYEGKTIFIGTVTDPYQPIEKKYQLMPKILRVLINYQNPIEILTKSDLILRDLDLLKQFKKINVNFTINTLDEKWRELVELNSPKIRDRVKAAEKLHKVGIKTTVLMGPLWPDFSDIDKLFCEFKKAGVSYTYSESFNTIGGNWTGVEKILKKYYPEKLVQFRNIMFNKEKFDKFYQDAETKIRQAVKQYKIPATVLFGMGHKRIKKEIR